MKLGAHISIAGGYQNALTRGNDIGCTVVQLFSKNANQWAAKPITPQEAELFAATREQMGYVCADLVVHDFYLINLATPDDTLWEKSLAAFGHELDRCESLGIPSLVTHAGAHVRLGRRRRPGEDRIGPRPRTVRTARWYGDCAARDHRGTGHLSLL